MKLKACIVATADLKVTLSAHLPMCLLKVTTEIEKNRGLTAHRRKDIKNPRKRHRLAFDKAQKRRKGQVPGMRQGGAAYGGEATGIKSKVSKSRRFG